jgi:hypothetical protein
MRNRSLGRSGSTLVLNLLVMTVFAMTSVIVYAAAKSQVKAVVNDARTVQARGLAEAGLEDALHALYLDPTWRSGFTAKSLAGGAYTVTVTSPSATTLLVTSVGFSSPLLLLGPAVKNVSATVVFVSSSNPSNAVRSGDLLVNGTVNSYDPRISLTPAAFTDGGTIWANSVTAAGCSSGSPRIFSNVLVLNTGTSPTANCVHTPPNTISSTTTLVSIPIQSCNAACQTAALVRNLNINTINPVTLPYSSSNNTLTVKAGDTVAMSSGTYYFKSVSVKGTLNVNTNAGPVKIFFTNSFTSDGSCAIWNESQIPSRLQIIDAAGSGAHTFTLQCPVALHAYIETIVAHLTLKTGQVVYGHFSGISSDIDAGATLHHDLSAGVAVSHVGWATGPSGTWAESYKRK